MPTILAALKALAAFFGLGEKVVEEVHDANQRTAGKNEIVAADLKEANEANDRVLKAAVATDRAAVDNSLRSGDF